MNVKFPIRNPYIEEFYNKCHVQSGADGGQFCSDDVKFAPGIDAKIKAKVQKTLDIINKVHNLPERFPKATVRTFSGFAEPGNSLDGAYNSSNDEIALNTDSEGQEITFVHEFGHHISLGEEGNYSLNQFLDKVDRTPTLRKVIDAIYASDTYQGVKERADKGNDHFFAYLADEREAFARAYAQWVAVRSNNKTLLTQMRKNRDNNPNFQWYDRDFTQIAEAFDEHFNKRENTTFALETPTEVPPLRDPNEEEEEE